MKDNFETVYNEETGCWEEKEEPYMTIEIPTEDDYRLLMKKIEFYDKNHDTIEQVKQAVKEFAEKVKMAFYYEFDEIIPSIMSDKIDELLKEYEK